MNFIPIFRFTSPIFTYREEFRPSSILSGFRTGFDGLVMLLRHANLSPFEVNETGHQNVKKKKKKKKRGIEGIDSSCWSRAQLSVRISLLHVLEARTRETGLLAIDEPKRLESTTRSTQRSLSYRAVKFLIAPLRKNKMRR